MVVRLDLVSRAASLSAAGHPFVWATVVRAQRPTSAKAGDSALVLADGEVSGFVGGECAESTVRAQALQVLSTGETRLLRITPDAAGDEPAAPAEDGVVAVHNPCLSGGTLEIFLEPAVPLPVVAVYGHAPIATALVRADRLFGLQVRAVTDPRAPLPAGTTAVVVASHGSDEVPVLSAALRAGVPYVGLVASRRRGPAVVGALDGGRRTARVGPHPRRPGHRGTLRPRGGPVDPGRDRVRTARAGRRPRRPGGLPRSEHPASSSPALSRDPVCGMPVAAAAASPHVETPAGRRVVLRHRLPDGVRRRPRRLPVVSRPVGSHPGDGALVDLLPDVDALRDGLDAVDYLADEGTVTALFCAARLRQPMLLEGEPGVGKTEAAKSLAAGAATPAGAAAVLRGHRPGRGAVRVELPASAAEHPAGRGARRDAGRGRPVRPRLPGRAAAAHRGATTRGRGRPCC